MESNTDNRPDPRKIVGLLADESRLRVIAGIVLGDGTLANLRALTGLDDTSLTRILGRLDASGLIEFQPSSGYRFRIEILREAARTGAPEKSGPTGLQSILRSGRLPRRRDERLSILQELADLFEPGHRYPEVEVNARLKKINPDYALLRRYLIDEGLLERANETSVEGRTVVVYWQTDKQVTNRD